MTDAELLERMGSRVPPTALLLGMKLLAVDSAAGTVRMSFEATPQFCNPMGSVQGGIIVAMLDDCAAMAAIVKAGTRIVVPSIEMKASFFGAAKAGTLYGEGRCIKLGRRVAFMEADLSDAEGRLLARLTTSSLPMPMPGSATLVERA